jgi:NAD dependent epimerase/dehydratase family enzyme
MHLILTGATGLVGTAVLDAMIRTKDITKISVLTRRPIKFTDDRINVIIHKDFASYDSDLLDKLQGAQACVWALGISQTQVSKESVSSPGATPHTCPGSLFP